MRNLIKFICMFLLPSIIAIEGVAQDNTKQLWERAQKAMKENNFEIAISNYEQLVEAGTKTDALFYNLGSAYYKNHQSNKAVLNFQKALVLNPKLTAASENIQFINNQQVNNIQEIKPVFFERWSKAFIYLLSPNGWAILSLFTLAGLGAFLVLHYKQRIPYFSRWCAALVVLNIVVFSTVYLSYQAIANSKYAVVMNATHLWDLGDARAKKGKAIPSGAVVTIQDENIAYKRVQVNLPNGQIGWLDSKEVEKIRY